MKKLGIKIKNFALKMSTTNWGYVAFVYLVCKDDKVVEPLFWFVMLIYSILQIVKLHFEGKLPTYSTKITVNGDLVTVKVTGDVNDQEAASRIIDALINYHQH
jgi:hypothetical protein